MTASPDIIPSKLDLSHERPRALRRLNLVWLWLRGQIRGSALALIVVAALVGAASGLATLTISAAARMLQGLLYGLSHNERLSAVPRMSVWELPILPLGGLLLGLMTLAWARRRPRPIVDPVEANALRGGRLSARDSLFVGVQSVLSNGFGASVGLEAAYAQLGGWIASFTGVMLNLRRSDLRVFVGAGAGAGIAAAFGAPLTGAFYAFEIIIGSYSLTNVAPVVAAALAGALVVKLLRVDPLVLHASVTMGLRAWHYLLFAGLGVVCAMFGVGVMRTVAVIERLAGRLPGPRWLRPALGGVILAALAFVSPQTLSAGHGAMRMDFYADLAVGTLVWLVLSKAAASAIALGFGFRGGLFFASLFLGALVGRLFILGLYAAGLPMDVDPLAGSLVGMGAMAVAIIGGPFTMSFLVLETTGDFGLTAATLTAAIVASVTVRETFGYSFSTWRLHLRGETIRGAHDVGWLRNLTANRMLRVGAQTAPATISVEAFRERFPLGSTRRVIALDETGRYGGILQVPEIHAADAVTGDIGPFLTHRDQWLSPQMTIKDILKQFAQTETDELAVVDEDRRYIGVLSEAYATRRYAEELEKARRDLVGAD